MANVFDVAQYILTKLGVITTWKLQKLCYYSQAWSLVWDEKPLFNERIEAWANGPVVPELYNKHKGSYYITKIDGDPGRLNQQQIETIDVVIEVYGDKTSAWLSELTHNEAPWINARRRDGLSPGERGNSEITLDDMAEYYCGIIASAEKEQ
jgi:uncharacterized phage-associated protein